MGLSPKLVDQVLDEIVRINAELGVAVLLVEQQAELALSVASRGYVLASGEIVLDGNARELLDNPHIQEAYLGKGHAPAAGHVPAHPIDRSDAPTGPSGEE